MDDNKKLEWIGPLGFKRLFDGTNTFKLNDIDNNTMELIHREQFAGLLLPIFKMKLEKETRLNFQKMNEALKERSEGLQFIKFLGETMNLGSEFTRAKTFIYHICLLLQ